MGSMRVCIKEADTKMKVEYKSFFGITPVKEKEEGAGVDKGS